jgi:hypothetical protein
MLVDSQPPAHSQRPTALSCLPELGSPTILDASGGLPPAGDSGSRSQEHHHGGVRTPLATADPD